FRAPSRKAAISSASAVGLPFGRCARKSFTVCVVSKAHDRLRAGARGGGGSCKRSTRPVQGGHMDFALLPPRRPRGPIQIHREAAKRAKSCLVGAESAP